METAPRQEKPGDVNAEFIILLFDPNLEAWARINLGYWNEYIKARDLCDASIGNDLNPVAWMPRPDPPSEEWLGALVA